MSRISMDAQGLIERLARLDPDRPRADKEAIERAFAAHFAILGLPPRLLVWVPDPEAGYHFIRTTARDTDHGAAWSEAAYAADQAADAAEQEARRRLTLLSGLVLAASALPWLANQFGPLSLLFAAAVILFRPVVLFLSTLSVKIWKEWQETRGLPGLGDLAEHWDDVEHHGWNTAAIFGFVLLLGVVPAIVIGFDAAAFGIAFTAGLVAMLVVAWIRTAARVAGAGIGRLGGFFADHPGVLRPHGSEMLADGFAVVVLSIVLWGILTAGRTATLVGLGFALAGGLAVWFLTWAALRTIAPASSKEKSKTAWIIEALLFAVTATAPVVLSGSPSLVIPVGLGSLVAWLVIVAAARRIARLLHDWDADPDDLTESAIRITWTIIVVLLSFGIFAAGSATTPVVFLGIGLTASGAASGWCLAQAAGWIAIMRDAFGNTARDAAAVAAIEALGNPTVTALRAIVPQRIRRSTRDAAGQAIDAIGEVDRAATLRRPAAIRRAAACRPFVDAFEAGLLMFWITRATVVCVLRPPMPLVNGLLHRADGPAIRWPSGTVIWFWRGVAIPGWAIEDPESLTLAAIRAEPDIEVRRRLAEVYGLPRYLRDSGARLIHEDACGKLWETRVGHEIWRIVEVVNGTPEPDGSRRIYTLDVTGAERLLGWPIDTARAAVAATYGLRPEQYRPEVRT